MFEWMISNLMGVKFFLLFLVLKLGIIIYVLFFDYVYI